MRFVFDAVNSEWMEFSCLEQGSCRHNVHVVICCGRASRLGAMLLAQTATLTIMWRVLFMYVQFEATSTTSGSKSVKNMWRELKRLPMWRRNSRRSGTYFTPRLVMQALRTILSHKYEWNMTGKTGGKHDIESYVSSNY